MGEGKFFGSKLDHALFIGGIVLISLVITGLLIYGQFFKGDPDVDDMTYENERPRFIAKTTFPVTMHVVGNHDDDRTGAIRRVTNAWKRATNGIADVNIELGWDPPVSFSIGAYESYELSTLWFLDPDDDNVALLLVGSDGPLDGASQGNFVVIIDRPRVKGALLETILAHELGHFFGLIHLKPEWPGLMLKDPSLNGSKIGKYDMVQFCVLYECDD